MFRAVLLRLGTARRHNQLTRHVAGSPRPSVDVARVDRGRWTRARAPGSPDHHNHSARGRVGRIFTSQDRAGESLLSSRLGLSRDAIEVTPELNFWHYVVDSLTSGGRIDHLIYDEVQFYSADQIDQLARVTDELQIDVFAFGILTDFRTKMFPASPRLVELADRLNVLQVEALCWCGKRATHQRPHRERRDGHRGRRHRGRRRG